MPPVAPNAAVPEFDAPVNVYNGCELVALELGLGEGLLLAEPVGLDDGLLLGEVVGVVVGAFVGLVDGVLLDPPQLATKTAEPRTAIAAPSRSVRWEKSVVCLLHV